MYQANLLDKTPTLEEVDYPTRVRKMTCVEEDREESTLLSTLSLARRSRLVPPYSSVFSQQISLKELLDEFSLGAPLLSSMTSSSHLPRDFKLRCIPSRLISILTLRRRRRIGCTNKKIIQRSSSPHYFPFVMVRKSDGSYRMAMDYRWINSISVLSRIILRYRGGFAQVQRR